MINLIWKSNLFKLIMAFILLLITVCAIICCNYPILSKWVCGNAQIIGKPIKATVYTDGRVNTDIKVYRDSLSWNFGKFNGYLLRLKEYDKYGMLQFINIDPIDTLIGRPVSSNEADYNIIDGIMFQSDIGAHFVDFRDNMKGFSFDPHMEFTSKEIKFKVPPKELKFDSVRIEFNRL